MFSHCCCCSGKKSPHHHLVSSTNQMALVHPRLTVKKEAVPSVFLFFGPLGARFCFVSGEIYSGLPSLAVLACSQEMGEIGFGSVRISRTVCHSNTHNHSLTYTHTYTHICTRANSKQQIQIHCVTVNVNSLLSDSST